MIEFECDRCGAIMKPNDPGRYIARIEIFAAASHLDLDHLDEADTGGLKRVLSDLALADPDDVEDRTYRLLRFDLCDPCRKAVLQSPI